MPSASRAAVHSVLLLLLLPTSCGAALLSAGYKLESPCTPSVAARAFGPDGGLLGPMPDDSEEDVQWVAVLPGLKALPTAMFTLPSQPTTVGAPSAVCRLNLAEGRLDHLLSTIPKESPEAVEVLGLCLDGALEAWLGHCASSGVPFESLSASSTPQTAAVLSSRGFSELETVDFSSLGRQQPILTHGARLPACILATERRAQRAVDVLDQAVAASLADALRTQPAPSSATLKANLKVDAAAGSAARTSAEEKADAPRGEGAAGTTAGASGGAATEAEEAEAESKVVVEEKRDPWANIKGFGH